MCSLSELPNEDVPVPEYCICCTFNGKNPAIIITGGSDEFLGSEGGTVMWTIKQATDYCQCIFEEIIAV